MPTREEMRRDYQRKRVLHKSALMFLYALGIAGAGFIFQDELQDGFEKIQSYASNINFQKQTGSRPVQNRVQNPRPVDETPVRTVEQAGAAQTVSNVQPVQYVQNVSTDLNVSRLQNPPEAVAARNMPAKAAQANSDMSAQTDADTGLSNERALELLNQFFKAMARPSVTVPLRIDSAAGALSREGLATSGLTTVGLKKEGLSNRLSALQQDKAADNELRQQVEMFNRVFPWVKVEQNKADDLVNDDKAQSLTSDSQSSLVQAFEQMDLEYKSGTVQKGCSVSKESCSFVESAQKAGLSKADISFITQELAGDIELGRMKAGDTFEAVTGVDKDKNVRQVVYVALTIQGKKYERYAWTDESGERNLYTPEGIRPTKEIMKFPVEFHKYVSSPFGMRKHPRLGVRRMHKGVDLALPTGTPIKAAADGIVTHAGWGGGYGNYIEIKHKNGYTTRYAHLSKFEKGLKTGNKVYAGQNIAKGGNTGIGTGPHLHFEVRINGTPVNPLLDHRLEGAKKLKTGQMGEFLAFVDAVHMDAADLPSRGFGLKKALANAKAPLPITEDNMMHTSSNHVPSFAKSRESRGLSAALSGKARVPMISFSMKNKRGNGS